MTDEGGMTVAELLVALSHCNHSQDVTLLVSTHPNTLEDHDIQTVIRDATGVVRLWTKERCKP